MEDLKAHKVFRNQLIITTVLLFGSSYFMPELAAFGFSCLEYINLSLKL